MTKKEWSDFGKSEKGRVIHFAAEAKDGIGIARCDKNILIVVNSESTMKDVSCKTCKQYKDYKDFIEASKPAVNDVKPKPKAKPKAKPKKKAGKTELVPKEDAVVKKKLPVQKSIKEIKKKKKESEIEEFSVSTVKSGKEKLCQVIHIKSNIPFFDFPSEITEDVVKTVCDYLNNMKTKWDKVSEPPPKNFISACRKCVTEAFKEHKLPIPTVIKTKKEIKRRKKKSVKKVEKKARTIKRRKKKEAKKEKPKRVIRRRGKKKKTIKRRKKASSVFGMNVNKPTGFIAGLINEGASVSQMVKAITDKFDLSEKIAERKIAGVVRKLTRKKSVKVMVILQSEKSNDIYNVIKED